MKPAAFKLGGALGAIIAAVFGADAAGYDLGSSELSVALLVAYLELRWFGVVLPISTWAKRELAKQGVVVSDLPSLPPIRISDPIPSAPAANGAKE